MSSSRKMGTLGRWKGIWASRQKEKQVSELSAQPGNHGSEPQANNGNRYHTSQAAVDDHDHGTIHTATNGESKAKGPADSLAPNESPPSSSSGHSSRNRTSGYGSDMAPRSSRSSPPAGEMVALARKIAQNADRLDEFLRDSGCSSPSFEFDAPKDYPTLPPDMEDRRREIIHDTKELRLLAIGPRESIRWGIWEFLDVLALQLINHYKLAELVPPEGSISISNLSKTSGLDQVNVARVLRLAMTNRVFREPQPGHIAHTAASRVLAEDANMQAWIGFNGEDIFPAASHVTDALSAYESAENIMQTGFNFAFDTVNKEPMFVTFSKDAERAKRMGLAMASLTGGEGYEVRHFIDTCDLSGVNDKGGTFVDVGGSHGFVCVELAKKYPSMHFVVEDLPKTIESRPRPIDQDPEVDGRITWLDHDFFTSQDDEKVKHADVYYFRWIMHNYAKPYAIKILRSLRPALKNGARIIINDHCLREPGKESPWDEAVMRRMDMVMLCLLNAQERTEDEFRQLFLEADPNFRFRGVSRPKGCRMSIVEAIWSDTPVGCGDSPPLTAQPVGHEA